MKKFEELSQRCQTILILMKKKEWVTYAWLADRSGMKYQQVNSVMELLRKHGYIFKSVKFGNRGLSKYKLANERKKEVKDVIGRNANANLERMTIEMNRIRLLADEKDQYEIKRIASQSLLACGILTEESLPEPE